jgi:hypothetical protein
MKKSEALVTKPKKTDRGMVLPVKQKVTLDLVKEIKSMKGVEDLGTAMLESAHQFNMITQTILKQKYGFSDTHLKEFNEEVKHALEGLVYVEEKGLNPLSGYSMDQLIDVTLNHYQMLKAARAGLSLPTDQEAAKLLMKKKK